jgi:tetratricopeptide (TPR) repeat protein
MNLLRSLFGGGRNKVDTAAFLVRAETAAASDNLSDLMQAYEGAEAAGCDLLDMCSGPRADNLRLQLARAYNRAGRRHLDEKDIPRAIDAYERELSFATSKARVHNDLAVAYFASRQFEKAIAHCDEATRLGEHVRPELLKGLERYRPKKTPLQTVEEADPTEGAE